MFFIDWNAMTEGATKLPGFDASTRRLVIVGLLFTYFLGLMARIPASSNPLAGAVFSLVMDTFLVLLLFTYLFFILRMKSAEINIQALLVTLAASGIGSAIIFAISNAIRYVFPAVTNSYQTRPLVIYAYITLLFCVWGMTALWLKIQRRFTEEAVNAANAERAAAVSELRRLRTQLDPHFLFNALNTALVEVIQRPKRAVLMLRELSGYLRYSLDTADIHFVSVAAELAMLRMFLRIQDIRFGAKLKYDFTVEEKAKTRLIPTFLLQPLVENAVKYGLPDDDDVLRVNTSVAMRGDDLVITVANTGDLALSNHSAAGTGTGLNNLRSRLALHYPGRHSFDMTQEDRVVRVTCILKGEPC